MNKELKMTNDDIAQKLALLPEGLAERNIQSWKETIEFLEEPVDAMIGEHFPYSGLVGKVAKAILKSEQAKLFKAGEQAYNLIISTTDGKVEIGEPYLIVHFGRGFLTAQYGINEEEHKYNLLKRKEDNIHFRTGDDSITFLQPMLDLLWDETRGKKNT
jgi:hypothetical protein